MRVISAAAFVGAILLSTSATHAQTPQTPAAALTPAGARSSNDIGPAEPWGAKPLGRYDLSVNTPEGAVPVVITITESAGNLSAALLKGNDPEAHTMAVTVKDTDLILNATTDNGPITINIKHHGQKLAGTWDMGVQRGTLEGSARN